MNMDSSFSPLVDTNNSDEPYCRSYHSRNHHLNLSPSSLALGGSSLDDTTSSGSPIPPHRIQTLPTTTTTTSMKMMKRSGIYQFILLVSLSIVYLIMTMQSMHSSSSLLSPFHWSMRSLTQQPSFHPLVYPDDTMDDQVDGGLRQEQVQHIVSHIRQSDSGSNILLWFGTQYIQTHPTSNENINNSSNSSSTYHDRLESILLYWNNIVASSSFASSNGIVVAIIERDSNNDGHNMMDDDYYQSLHKRYTNLYIYTVQYTRRGRRNNMNALQKQLEHYVQHRKIWSNQLTILPRKHPHQHSNNTTTTKTNTSTTTTMIIPNDRTILDTTIFDVIIIDRPGRSTNSISNSKSAATTTSIGIFQSIYTTQQIIQNSFELMMSLPQSQQHVGTGRQRHPIHVFVVMDTTDERGTSTIHTNIEKTFADLVFDRTPIRIIPSSTDAATATTTSDSSSQDPPPTIQRNTTHSQDLAHYVFYHNDHNMIQSKPGPTVTSTNDQPNEETIKKARLIQKELTDVILQQYRQYDTRGNVLASQSFLPRPKDMPVTVLQSSATTMTTTSEPSNSFLTIDEPIAFHHKNKHTKPIMSIITSALSTKDDKTRNNVYETFLYRHLISSIIRTVGDVEQEYWTIQLYVAIDDTDTYWIEHWKEIKNIPHWLQLFFVLFPDRGSHIPFNEIALTAYHAGADYFCRVNDDTEFLSSNWITMGVRVLLQQYDPPNLGVVGPLCNEGNKEIMTHDMVHRTHLEIFGGYYYPEVFQNWYLDDWITNVYATKVIGIDRSKVVQDWIVKHWIADTRYQADLEGKHLLSKEYQIGRQSIYDYVIEQYPQRKSVSEAMQKRFPKAEQ